MSQILSDVTLTLNTASPVSLSGYPPVNIYWIAFINTSPYALRATVGSSAVNIPAWYYYPVFVGGKLTGNISVTPTAQTVPGFNFQSTLSTTLYAEYERPSVPIPQPLGGSPVGMTASGTALAVDNEGNPAGTVFITGKVLGDAQAAFVVTNDGIVAIGDATNPGSLSVVGPITATGNIKGDHTNNLVLDTGGPGKAIVFDANGVQKGFIDSNGFTFNSDLNFPVGVGVAALNNLTLKNGTLDVSGATGTAISLPLGSLTRWSKFTGQATITPTFFNHLLGVTPDVVIVTFNSTSSTAHSFAIDYSTITSTQVKITSDGTNNFVALAIKF